MWNSCAGIVVQYQAGWRSSYCLILFSLWFSDFSGAGEFGIEEVYTLPETAAKDEVASLKDSQKVVQKFMEYAESQSEVITRWPRIVAYFIVYLFPFWRFQRLELLKRLDVEMILCVIVQIKCEGMVVSGETQAKVIEGLTALEADAVVVGSHDRSAVSRWDILLKSICTEPFTSLGESYTEVLIVFSIPVNGIYSSHRR